MNTVNDESPLRQSLDAIDSARRRAYATFAVGWVATFVALLWFTHVIRTSTDLRRALAAAVVALVFATLCAGYSVMFYMTRMTKQILRAIDIAVSRPRGGA